MSRTPLDGRLLFWFFIVTFVLGVLGEGLMVMLLVVSGENPFWGDGDMLFRAFALPLVPLCVGFTGLVAAATLRRGESVTVMRLTVILAVAAGVLLAAYLMWHRPARGLLSVLADGRYAGCAVILLLLLTLIGQADRQAVETSGLQTIRRLVYVNASLFSAMLMLLIWLEWWRWSYSGLTFGLLGSWGALSLAAFAIVPTKLAAGRGRRRTVAKESIPSRISLLLTCPKCRFAQALPTGLVRCAKCQCPLVIDVEEPRCACGYLLYRLEGSTCPECGRVIETEKWWMA